MANKGREKLAALPPEELERRLREAFFYTDRIDDTVFRELEALRQALEAKDPREYERTPEESWERFQEDHAEELAEFCRRERRRKAAGKNARLRTAVRGALLAAVILVFLAGAALAAEPLGLLAWVPRWNAAAGRYTPVSEEAAGKPIPAALRKLGIMEPVYPGWLPEGFVLTESHISKDPLVLMEQYARGDQRLSITVTPIKGFKSAVYLKNGMLPLEYSPGRQVNYIFENEDTITVVRYTKNYATTISADISFEEIKQIISLFNDISEGEAKHEDQQSH